ncbi:hypothetical protein HYS93_02335 [Candidatus Daviesbacteria bacterium]|nr:hypothetical protein [Candidatus Daviesbacteria bacterium]
MRENEARSQPPKVPRRSFLAFGKLAVNATLLGVAIHGVTRVAQVNDEKAVIEKEIWGRRNDVKRAFMSHIPPTGSKPSDKQTFRESNAMIREMWETMGVVEQIARDESKDKLSVIDTAQKLHGAEILFTAVLLYRLNKRRNVVNRTHSNRFRRIEPRSVDEEPRQRTPYRKKLMWLWPFNRLKPMGRKDPVDELPEPYREVLREILEKDKTGDNQ